MRWYELLGLVGVGAFAGTVNTIAGGGSLIGIPALIFFGLPANQANATNRIGVLIQSLVATREFRREGLFEARDALILALPTCAGALLGSLLSVDIDEALFRKVIAVAMLLMLALILSRPRRWLEGREPGASQPALAARVLGFFAIGVYGGFLQAGVGIFLIAGLVLLTARDLVRANAIKALLVGLLTLPALAVYLANDLLIWQPGLALALGAGAGGWLGTRLTVSWGPAFVRVVLLAVIVVSSSRLLGLW